MPEFGEVTCPYCQRTMADELETAYILIPRLDTIRFKLIQAQALLPRIEAQATMYQPGIRRLCGEATFLLAENVGTLRATIAAARHHRPPRQEQGQPTWW